MRVERPTIPPRPIPPRSLRPHPSPPHPALPHPVPALRPTAAHPFPPRPAPCARLPHVAPRQVRGVVAFDRTQLLPIEVPAGTQPCKTFGLNPVSDTMRDLFDDGQLAFLANIGTLVEPVADKDEFRLGGKRQPSHSTIAFHHRHDSQPTVNHHYIPPA